jgi:hypothetical protein
VGRIGVAELMIILGIVLGPLVLGAVGIYVYRVVCGRRAKRFGYESTRAYLRAAPRSDAEKRDAADLALRGLVFCVLGLLFAPFVLIGLIPLFYGGRKLVYAAMGLGLVDDADQPGA